MTKPEPLTIVVDEIPFTRISLGGSRGYGWTSPRWRCDVCERIGMGTDEHPYGAGPATRWGRHGGWASTCLHGHAPCPWCGRVLALRKDGTPRVHSRCPERPDDAELLRSATREAREIARLGVRGPLTRDSRNLLDRLTTNPGRTDT